MTTITLKYTEDSTTYTQDIDCVDYYQIWHEEATEYSDINWDYGKIRHAKYKKWVMVLGMVSTTIRAFIAAWQVAEEPKFVYDSTEYGPLKIESVKNKHSDGEIIVIQRAAE